MGFYQKNYAKWKNYQLKKLYSDSTNLLTVLYVLSTFISHEYRCEKNCQ